MLWLFDFIFNSLTEGKRPKDKKENQSASPEEPITSKESKKTKTTVRKSGLQQSAFRLLN
jgi:hypothetical protein